MKEKIKKEKQKRKIRKITLISPSKYGEKFKRLMTPNLALLILAGKTPNNIKIEILHEAIDNINYNSDSDIIGISAFTSSVAYDAYRIADKFLENGKIVVLGGIHVSYMPQEALKHATAIVKGEAEELWPKLLKDFENGKLKKIYQTDKKPDMVGWNLRRDLLNPKKFWTFNVIQTTRGCTHNCDFCTVHDFNGRKLRHRPLKEVINEIKNLKGKFLYFADDNIFADSKYFLELCNKIKNHKKNWFAQADWLVSKRKDCLKAAKEAGCKMLFIGLESVSKKSLEEANKQWNKAEDFEKAMKKIRSYGIAVCGSFMYGFDNEPEDIWKDTVNFAKKNLDLANFCIRTPLVGSDLYRNLDKEGKILSKRFDLYDVFHGVINFKNKNLIKLRNNFYNSYKSFYTFFSSFKRALKDIKYLINPFNLIKNIRFGNIGIIFPSNMAYWWWKYTTLDRVDKKLKKFLKRESKSIRNFLDKTKKEAETIYCYLSKKKRRIIEYAGIKKGKIVSRLNVKIKGIKNPIGKTHGFVDRFNDHILQNTGKYVNYGKPTLSPIIPKSSQTII